MKKITLVIASIWMGFAFAPAPQKTKIFANQNKSTISYDMNHPMHAWTGVSHEVTSALICSENKDSLFQVAVAVKIASFDSDNSNRDSHAMEVTEALKFPSITFMSSEIKPLGLSSFEVTGNLKFHGVAHRISFKIETQKEGSQLIARGEFLIKMTDYGIDPPTLMGISTDDEFKIHFEVYY